MFGTEVADDPNGEILERLEAVLDRRMSVEPLRTLVQAINDRPKDDFNLNSAAIGIDSSVFIRLAQHKRSADVLDYLPRHAAPLILPGQAIQEFWNNRLSVVDTVSRSLKRNFDQLAREAQKVDGRFGGFDQRIVSALANLQPILDEFEAEYGHIYEKNTRDSIAKMLAMLEGKASCNFVPRTRFRPIAHVRKITKTPPGFKDDGDGDFFIWADFLYSLLLHRYRDESSFERVVLLTNDEKPDWSTNGLPHPVLSAEVSALFDVPFDLWNLESFVSQVGRALDEAGQA